MNSLIAAGHYRPIMKAFGMKTATLYTPANMSSQPGMPGVPLLPLN